MVPVDKDKILVFENKDFDMLWDMAQNYAWERYQDYIADHDGKTPTHAEVQGFLDDAFMTPMYEGRNEGIIGSVKDFLGIAPDEVEFPLTNAEMFDRGFYGAFYNPNTGRWSINLVNGGTFELTEEQYNRIVEGGERADLVLGE